MPYSDDTKKKYSVKLNSVEKIEQLLQETYDQACQELKQIQDEINKVVKTTPLNELDIDGKEKYGKIVNNYLTLEHKTIAQKIDIAKLMTEVYKHDGNINDALNDMKSMPSTIDTKKLKEMLKTQINQPEEGDNYNLKQ